MFLTRFADKFHEVRFSYLIIPGCGIMKVFIGKCYEVRKSYLIEKNMMKRELGDGAGKS